MIVSDEDMEGSLFGVAVFAGFLIIEVFDDLEGGEFAGITASIGAKAGATHATVLFDADEFRDRGVGGKEFAFFRCGIFSHDIMLWRSL